MKCQREPVVCFGPVLMFNKAELQFIFSSYDLQVNAYLRGLKTDERLSHVCPR